MGTSVFHRGRATSECRQPPRGSHGLRTRPTLVPVCLFGSIHAGLAWRGGGASPTLCVCISAVADDVTHAFAHLPWSEVRPDPSPLSWGCKSSYVSWMQTFSPFCGLSFHFLMVSAEAQF